MLNHAHRKQGVLAQCAGGPGTSRHLAPDKVDRRRHQLVRTRRDTSQQIFFKNQNLVPKQFKVSRKGGFDGGSTVR